MSSKVKLTEESLTEVKLAYDGRFLVTPTSLLPELDGAACRAPADHRFLRLGVQRGLRHLRIGAQRFEQLAGGVVVPHHDGT